MNLISAIPSKSRIVILDACRNNPFDSITDTTGAGLAIVNAPAGTVVSYSTSPGATAEDGWDGNSPFTSAFVGYAHTPGASIASVFQSVRETVHKATSGRQTPWDITALTSPFTFFPGENPPVAPEPEKAEDNSPEQWRTIFRESKPRDAYNKVVQIDNITIYNIFIEIFPDSEWTGLIQIIAQRRQEMLDWFDVVSINTIDAFDAFLEKYPNSDLRPTAERLRKRARPTMVFTATSTRALSVDDVVEEPRVREVVKWKTRTVTKWKTKTVTKTKWKTKWKTKTVVKKVPVVKYKTRVVVKTIPIIKWRIKRVPGKCKRGHATSLETMRETLGIS